MLKNIQINVITFFANGSISLSVDFVDVQTIRNLFKLCSEHIIELYMDDLIYSAEIYIYNDKNAEIKLNIENINNVSLPDEYKYVLSEDEIREIKNKMQRVAA